MIGERRTTATAIRASCGTPAGRPAAPASVQTCRCALTLLLASYHSNSNAMALQLAIIAVPLMRSKMQKCSSQRYP